MLQKEEDEDAIILLAQYRIFFTVFYDFDRK